MKNEEEKTAAEMALDDITLLIDAPEWEYPGQVVRDVAKALGMSLDQMAEKLKDRYTRDTREEMIQEAIEYITDWRDKAYPLDIFPEYDPARAHELLQAGGITLDAVSASMGRHVLTRVCEILEEKGLIK